LRLLDLLYIAYNLIFYLLALNSTSLRTLTFRFSPNPHLLLLSKP
jgi:hypothetical protein